MMTHETLDYVSALRSKGHRVTPQRLIVLDAVCDVGGHATIGEIQLRVKELDLTIDPSTIYRALDVLCEVGLVTVSEFPDTGKVYKIAGESAHHHLVCQSCGAILTVDADIFESAFQRIYKETGFRARADHLALTGVCRECAEK
jgi:Fur family ferric uptake transcriptional regulator